MFRKNILKKVKNKLLVEHFVAMYVLGLEFHDMLSVWDACHLGPRLAPSHYIILLIVHSLSDSSLSDNE
jgi:hypothetical protein